MSAKFSNFEIVLLYLLLLTPCPPTQVIKLLCSQDSSRLVRKIVRSKWTPILDKYQVKLPLECPLHPERDLFAPRQDAKKRDRPTQWTCALCGKSFYQEKFLDQHFETRHKSLINEAQDVICLADLCDIMRCEVFQTEESSSLKAGDQHVSTDIEVWGDSLGQNCALAKANAVYLSLMPLRTSASGSARAGKVQNRQLCQDTIGQNKLRDCDIGTTTTNDKSKINAHNDPVARKKDHLVVATSGSARSTNLKHNKGHKTQTAKSIKKNQSDELNTANSNANTNSNTNNNINANTKTSGDHDKNAKNDGDDTNNNNNTGNDEMGNGENNGNLKNGSDNNNNNNTSNAQRMRSNCKAEELSKLKTKCENLIHNCISGLILSMSDQSHKEMEEEMNKAVCWYLTCDRYWEDGPLEPRAFPWGLILILILILSTGICFCYYIIWILFDSEETTINTSQYMYMPPYGPYGTEVGAGTHGPVPNAAAGMNMSVGPQPYYYQQQPSVHDLYPELPQYDYRHSPRRYIAEPRQQGTPTAGSATPLHHHTHPHQQHQSNLSNLAAYHQQDILDRRDYTSSLGRNIATTSVAGGSTGPNGSKATLNVAGTSSTSTGTGTGTGTVTNVGSSAVSNIAHDSEGNIIGSGGGVVKNYYNTHPRPLESHHRHTGASQQSLRTSSSTHEIIQNEVGHNEHYIYVTYPPDLKKRFFEKYE